MRQPISPPLHATLKYNGRERTVETRIPSEFLEKVLWALNDLHVRVPAVLICDECGQRIPLMRWTRHKLEECQALSDTSTPEEKA